MKPLTLNRIKNASHLTYLNILLLLLFSFTSASAQNDLANQTSHWDISQQEDQNSGTTRTQQSLVILTSNMVSWGQSPGTMYEMSISEINGSWNQSTNTGEVICDVNIPDDGGSGTVTFAGDGSTITVEIDITFSNGSSHLLLTCSNVTYYAN